MEETAAMYPINLEYLNPCIYGCEIQNLVAKMTYKINSIYDVDGLRDSKSCL